MRMIAGVLTSVLLATPFHSAAAQTYIEVDPFGYLLSGYSVHAGKIFDAVRAEAGAYGLRVPGSLLGKKGWTRRIDGIVVDVDFVGSSRQGLFAGLTGSSLRTRYTLDATSAHATHTLWDLGPRMGYIWIPGNGHFYVAPWANVGYIFNPGEITVSGETYAEPRWQPFLTVHLGWRF